MAIKKWKLHSEKSRFKTRWWSVVERKFTMGSGRKVSWFVLKKPNAVCVFCLTKEGKVVAIEYFRPGIRKIVVDLPCGYINKGETPLKAAKRELMEETGYAAKKFVYLGEYAGNSQGDTLMLPCFLALGGEKAGKQNLDYGEEIEVRILGLKELLGKIRAGKFADSTRITAVFLALEKLGKLKIKL